MSGSFLSGQPVKCAQGGEFHIMHMSEMILAPSDDGCIDDAAPDHLDGTVKCHQRGCAGCGDRIAGSHEPVTVADEAGRSATESAQQRGVIRGHASGLHLPFDGSLLIRREGNGPFDIPEDIVNVRPDDHIGEGPRRLSRVLGNEDRDSLARDVRLQDAGCPDCPVRQPQGNPRGLGHGPEIMGGNPEFMAGDGKVQEGAHLAVGLVRNLRPGIIKKRVIPPRRRDQRDPALHGQACSPDFLRTAPQDIEYAHPGDGNPFTIVSAVYDSHPSTSDPGG